MQLPFHHKASLLALRGIGERKGRGASLPNPLRARLRRLPQSLFSEVLSFSFHFNGYSSSTSDEIPTYNKQLLDEVFVISEIINVEITLTETLIIEDITKTSSNNCFIIYGFSK
jgi:hypothetical protein